MNSLDVENIRISLPHYIVKRGSTKSWHYLTFYKQEVW
jgi:hypothetical protein